MDSVKQSAALCLLRLYRTSPDLVPMGDWTSRVVHLLNDQHLGVVTAATSLITTLAQKNPEEFKTSVSLAVSRLSRIVTSASTDLQDYTYYFVPAPWLSVKLLRLLQCYPPPDPAVRGRLTECLETILNKAQEPPKSKKVQHSNAKNAVLFEAISLIIHHDSEPNLLVRACNQLGQFLQHRETNLRYLALESMCTLASSEFSHEAVKTHIETVINALKTERDVSVRQRAVDLLYAMCDRSNAQQIVAEMLSYLETADYSIREEILGGCGVLGVGIWLAATQGNFATLSSSFPSLSAANLLIVTGTFVMAIGFVGCIGALKENKCLLLTFFVLLLLVFLLEATIAVLFFAYSDKIDSYAQQDLKKGLHLYGTQGNVGLTNAWSIIQTDFRCCGLHEPGTWWKSPCYETVKAWLQENLLAVGIFGLCTALVQILGLTFAMTMYCQVVKADTYCA